MSRIHAVLAGLAGASLTLAPATAVAAQDETVKTTTFTCPDDLSDVPEDIASRCRGALEEASQMGQATSQLTIVLPVAALAAAGIAIATTQDDDRPVSR